MEENWYMNNKPENKIDAAEMRHKVLTIVGIVLCVLLLPILIMNCIMIVQSMINDDEVPGIGGYSPLIVLTDSMDPTIASGDIIIVQQIDGKDVQVEDVISFFDPAGNGTSVVTHRVMDLKEENGTLYFQTQGDNNNTPDRVWVSENNLVGKWTEIRIPFAGHVALFMQTTGGLIVCVFVPLALLIAYDFLRRKKADQSKQDDVAALMKELEALKAAQAAGVTSSVATPSEAQENAPVEEPAKTAEPETQAVEATAEDTPNE